MNELFAFVDVDTQVDFMLPEGKLYVPGAEQIIPNLARLMAYAREHHILVLSSADAHPPDDPSFTQWPPHCVIGTPGQRRIPATLFPAATIVANQPGVFTLPKQWAGQVIIEKTDYDVSTNPNFDAVLAAVGPRRFVVFGVATEFCVRAAVLALRKRDLPVDLVTDAIRAITPDDERKAMNEMLLLGARPVTTDQVCVLRVHEAAS